MYMQQGLQCIGSRGYSVYAAGVTVYRRQGLQCIGSRGYSV